MSRLLALILFLPLFWKASLFSAEDEILVRLGNEYPLLPTHVENFEAKESSFPRDYLLSLRGVLAFDISQNGMMRAIEGKERKEIEEVVGTPSFSGEIPLDSLAKAGLSFLIRSQMNGKELQIKIVQIGAGTIRNVSPVTLTGELAQDRRKIHQIADFIFQTLFGDKGISTAKIVYIVKTKIGKSKDGPVYSYAIEEADYDGANRRQLLKSSHCLTTPLFVPAPSVEVKGASLSPSAGVLFVSYEIGQPKIYYLNIRQGTIERVCSMRGNQLTPALAPDGSALAFSSDITGTADLFFVPFLTGSQAIGKPRQIFHSKGCATASPSFSPDGKKIAFVSNKDGSPKIYIMDIPESGTKVEDLKPRLLSKKCKESTAPAWSPDGKKIAFTGKSQGVRQIWVYDFERDQEAQLSDSKEMKESPSWAKDSLHIAFHALTTSGNELYLVNLHNGVPVKISSGPGEKQYVVWEQ